MRIEIGRSRVILGVITYSEPATVVNKVAGTVTLHAWPVARERLPPDLVRLGPGCLPLPRGEGAGCGGGDSDRDADQRSSDSLDGRTMLGHASHRRGAPKVAIGQAPMRPGDVAVHDLEGRRGLSWR